MRSARWLMLVCGLVAGLAVLGASPGVARADTTRLGPLAVVAGPVQSCPSGTRLGTWVVGGQRLQVAESTVFVEAGGPARQGAEVMVLAQVRDNGELQALMVRTQTQAQVRRAEALMAQVQRATALAARLREQAVSRLRTQDQMRTQQQLQAKDQARTQLQSRDQSCTQEQSQLQDQAQTQRQEQTRTRAMQGR